MERLLFVCPKTGRKIDAGVETDIGTLLRIEEKTLRAHCPACGGWHEWTVREAFLVEGTWERVGGADAVEQPRPLRRRVLCRDRGA